MAKNNNPSLQSDEHAEPIHAHNFPDDCKFETDLSGPRCLQETPADSSNSTDNGQRFMDEGLEMDL
jgi:hypothetical protein